MNVFSTFMHQFVLSSYIKENMFGNLSNDCKNSLSILSVVYAFN